MTGCSTCGTSRRELCHDRTGDLLCLRCYLSRYRDEILTNEDIAKALPNERPRTERNHRVRPESLARAAAALADRRVKVPLSRGTT